VLGLIFAAKSLLAGKMGKMATEAAMENAIGHRKYGLTTSF
jgi:hypothetical protein